MAIARRRPGSSASAPPTNRPVPASPSAIPSINPSAAAGAPKVEVTKLGSSDVGTSCPMSARKLAVPIPPTPGVSHGRRSTPSASTLPVAGVGSSWLIRPRNNTSSSNNRLFPQLLRA